MTQPHARSRCNQRSRELILLREIQDDIHFYNRHFYVLLFWFQSGHLPP